MKKVVIIGPTGMLGSMVYDVLQDKYQVILVFRDQEKLQLLDQNYGGVGNHRPVYFDLSQIANDYLTGFSTSKLGPTLQKFVSLVGPVDAIINCAGIIKPYTLVNPQNTLLINSILPHLLSLIYQDRLIHISTDCVFNGIDGAPYDEEDLPSPTDWYGLSKSLGEPKEHSLVFRTSLIGPEIANFRGLLQWFKSQKGKKVKGFINHFWNGLTTKQLAKIIDQIIANRQFPQKGLFHLFSTPVSKYDMLTKFRQKYHLDITIIKDKSNPIDRRLTTVYRLCQRLNIPTFDQMLAEL